MRRSSLCVLVLVLAGPERVGAELVIDSDTTINGPVDETIRIVDGPTAPTVEIVEPAAIGGKIGVFGSGTVRIAGGTILRVAAQESSTVTMSDGRVTGIDGYDHARVNVLGGEVDEIRAYENSSVSVSGGSFTAGQALEEELLARDASIIDVFGYDLDFTADHLTGTLADGSPIDVTAREYGNGRIVLHEVPEPSALALLGLAALFVGGCGRRRRCAD